jgi:ribosome-binding factor A
MALIRGDFPTANAKAGESQLPCHITITYVAVTPDLRNATVFFAPTLVDKLAEVLEFFEIQKHHFKKIIAQKMRLRFVPELQFKLDDSLEYSKRIDELLKHDSDRK